MHRLRRPLLAFAIIYLALEAWIGLAQAQSVAQVCNGYAELAVRQNQQSLQLNCGLTGPQWNSDYRYHYDWCVQGRNSESATRWNQWRDSEIARCRTAKTQPPAVKPQPPAVKSPAPQAPSRVAQICAGYAQQAVQQSRQNAQAGCGLSGPQWNSEYNYHYDWCVQGRNSESAARWNQWRDGEIAKCRAAKAKQPIPPAGKSSPVALPSKWDQVLRSRLPDLVRYLDQKTGVHMNSVARTQTQWTQRRADAFRKATAVTASLTDAEIRKRIDAAAAAFKLRQGASGPQLPESVLQSRPPQITTVVIEPRNDVIEPSSAILIGGVNFRDRLGRSRPGQVLLRYSDFPVEFGPKPKAYEVELMPLKGTWEESWTETLILVRVPASLQGERFIQPREGQVVIVFADGASLARDVTIYGIHPFVTEVATSSGTQLCCRTTTSEEWRQVKGTTNFILQPIQEGASLSDPLPRANWVQPNDSILITGRYFGSTPGKAHLALTRAIGGRTTVQLMALKPSDWSDTKILLRAENFPTVGYVEMQRATLVIETATGFKVERSDFAFGPAMHLRIVSGIKWFKATLPSAPQYTKLMPASNGAAMLVVHTPECGFDSLFLEGGKQEEGGDRYTFPPRIHPAEVAQAISRGVNSAKVVQVTFKEIDPENPYGDLDFFADMLGDLPEAILGGVVDWFGFVAKKLVQAIALSGGGGYHANVMGLGAEGATVSWETSCAHEKPIIYTISFIVVGPKNVLDSF